MKQEIIIIQSEIQEMLKKDANYPVQPTHRESLSNKESETFERFHTLLLIQNRREGIHIIKHLLMDNDFMIMNLV